MNRRQFLKSTLAAGTLATMPPRLWAAQDAPPQSPNIILAMSDDHGSHMVGYDGNAKVKTPNLDAMAKRGLVFRRFYSAGAICSPSRVACVTGRFPGRYPGGTTLGCGVGRRDITQAVALKTRGYLCGHFGKSHGHVAGAGGYDEVFYTSNDRAGAENSKSSAQVIWAKAQPFVRRAAKENKPFFMTLWFHEPHVPSRAVEKYRAMYGKDDPWVYADVSQMDDHVGMLRTELRDLGIADNTLIWFCGDNGARFKSETGGLRGGKGDIFEGGVRVPGVLEWPAVVNKARTVEARCGQVDFYPTILGLLGITMPKQPLVDGVDLSTLIRGAEMKQRGKPMFFWCDSKADSPAMAMTEDRYKFLSSLELPGPKEEMLFDLDADPNETRNLIREQPEVAKRMRAALADWHRSAVASQEGKDYP
jgi:arylsulfatase A-like enzyme